MRSRSRTAFLCLRLQQCVTNVWVKELVRECVLVHHWCGDLDTTNSIVPTPTAPGLAVYRGSNFSPVCSGDPNAASSASSQLYLRNVTSRNLSVASHKSKSQRFAGSRQHDLNEVTAEQRPCKLLAVGPNHRFDSNARAAPTYPENGRTL